eukprot:jgi/Mesvir1/5109/Mv15268-RA.2
MMTHASARSPASMPATFEMTSLACLCGAPPSARPSSTGWACPPSTSRVSLDTPSQGYYARWAAIRRLLTDFLLAGGEAAGPKQVLSLGAGYDTAYFQTHSEGTLPSYRCFELDYLEVTRKKAMFIQQNERLRTRLGETATIDPDKGHVHSPGGYHLLPVDLRDVDAMEAALSEHGFDYSLPTFILSECVLVYLKPEAGEALVRWGASRLRTAVFVLYEQVSALRGYECSSVHIY